MPETDFAGLYYPAGAQDAVVAADLMHLADDIDQSITLIAQDAADRDARYSDVQAGRIVSAVNGVQWVKVSSPPDAPKWLQTFADTGWQTSGVVSANTAQPIVINGQRGRVRGGVVSCWVSFTWNGAPLVFNSTGDITNMRMGNLLGRYVPPFTTNSTFSTAAWNGHSYLSSADGGIWIKNASPAQTIATGASVDFSFTFLEDV